MLNQLIKLINRMLQLLLPWVFHLGSSDSHSQYGSLRGFIKENPDYEVLPFHYYPDKDKMGASNTLRLGR